MDRRDLTSLLVPSQLPIAGGKETTSSRSQVPVGHFLEKKLLSEKNRAVIPHSTVAAVAVASSTTLLPRLIAVTGRILQELETQVSKLLNLNPSRREAVAQYLDRLSGHSPGPTALHGNTDSAGGLRRWVQGPRTSSQNAALKTYFEEVALVTLGQALVLKAWSDRGVRTWSQADLGRLNWVLSTALKPHAPIDREGWQITRPNLYSWYSPAASIQEEIWQTLESFRVADEGLSLMVSLLGPARQSHPATAEPRGYDSRFFQAIWSQLPLLGMDLRNQSGPLNRNKVVFSPTLRDGAMVRTAPRNLSWVGMESSPYHLLVVELLELWWGPAAPPLWTQGIGLEAHARDQLSLALTSPKPSLLSRISEMEACDLSFVLEERIIRAQGRAHETTAFRAVLESLPYFKNLRAPGVTLGALQACVALSKLRPGGLLWWGREEPLTSQEGEGVLSFLLERGKILCEWDLSALTHSLPSLIPLFPKYLYLIAREVNLEDRSMHRPMQVSLRGQIRSHVEIPVMLEDALGGLKGNEQARGHWEVSARKSPTAQKDWAAQWPDRACQKTLTSLEELRTASVPLASYAMVKAAPQGQVHPTLHGLWLQVDYSTAEGRLLRIQDLPRDNTQATGTGFFILLAQADWVGVIRQYLMSPPIHAWLECHAERRGERWIIDEQFVKWIPIPKALLRRLGATGADLETSKLNAGSEDQLNRLTSRVSDHPAEVKSSLAQVPLSVEGTEIRAAVLVEASRTLEKISAEKNKVLSVVQPDGAIRWDKLLAVLPNSEMVPVTLHPRVKISGALPPHLPVLKWDRVKAPCPGILLSTESGKNLLVTSDSSLILDIIWNQLNELSHPTWNEILGFARLPRRLELAETTARDVLVAHGNQSTRVRQLHELISACIIF